MFFIRYGVYGIAVLFMAFVAAQNARTDKTIGGHGIALASESGTFVFADTIHGFLWAADLVFVAGDTFTMGCNGHEAPQGECYPGEQPSHRVSVNDFLISRYEVTQIQWRSIMGKDPSGLKHKGCDQCPVEWVSWNDIQLFLQKLNALTGEKYRLPTEAEWEYAARGGRFHSPYLYSGSNKLDEVGWYIDNSGNRTQPVGGKKPNQLGLHDMSGNVSEWCADDWHGNYRNAPTDGRDWTSEPRGDFRVLRGGSALFLSQGARVACRAYGLPDNYTYDTGFRLALSHHQ
jgi:formylglycine-generating enzyme required for sulfatase activity